MKYILFFVLVSASFADKVMMHDENNELVNGTATLPATDYRRLVVTDTDFDAMKPFVDKRGCSRWKKVNGKVEFIPVAERRVSREQVRQAWADLAGWRARGLDALITGLGADADLKSFYDSELARLQAVYDELTRPGKTSDDPTPPAKTTITPK